MKKTVADIDITDARYLVRVDFNVPMAPGATSISDDSRIRASLPTINYLRARGARIILASHLGRPKGVDESLRMAPIAARLEELLGAPVLSASESIGEAVEEQSRQLAPGGLLLLENVRFHSEEEANDPAHAEALARLADVFVNDAFGTAHRAHASTEGIARLRPAVAGFLMDKELRMLGGILDSPRRPIATLMGGAKVGDKMAVMERLIETSDFLIVGGGMAAAFLAARGHRTGKSLLEADGPQMAARIESAAKARGVQLLIPTDLVVAQEFSAKAEALNIDAAAIPADAMLLDIGPRTREAYTRAMTLCQTVLWNGPMGVFEFPQFAEGTATVARSLADHAKNGATVVVGGGSTAEAVASLGLADSMTHVSTGGGAALEFLEGKTLPGVAVLQDAD